MQPYFSESGVTIYHAAWEAVWPTLGLGHKDVALLWADPPYGVNAVFARHGRRKGGNANRGTTERRWEPIHGDDSAFNPSPLIAFPNAVLWGANHYASRLPDSSSWWCWHKRPGMADGVDFADGELAWTNLGGQARFFAHAWMGVVRPSENGARMLHPTQKPVALATWGFQRAKLQRGDLVFSPYLGSGPEARAALDMGLRLIGCEVAEQYCEAAANRLRQRNLFGGVP
jgi:site-specific DNA-methyltransferase (adenine-specific)